MTSVRGSGRRGLMRPEALAELLEDNVPVLLGEQMTDAHDDGDGPLDQSQGGQAGDRSKVGERALRRQLYRSESGEADHRGV